MQDTLAPKLPLDALGEATIQRLGKWLRVVGTIQLALSGIALILLLFQFACGFALGGPLGAGVVVLAALIPIAMAGTFLLQALRTQESGEQIKNLAEEHDLDYLELTFVRLKTVFIIDIVIGALLAANTLL